MTSWTKQPHSILPHLAEILPTYVVYYSSVEDMQLTSKVFPPAAARLAKCLASSSSGKAARAASSTLSLLN